MSHGSWLRPQELMMILYQCIVSITAVNTISPAPQNAFVQLSLAYRNDNYTLETRMKQAERERHLTEENTEKELEEFKGALKVSSITFTFTFTPTVDFSHP